MRSVILSVTARDALIKALSLSSYFIFISKNPAMMMTEREREKTEVENSFFPPKYEFPSDNVGNAKSKCKAEQKAAVHHYR